MRAFELRKLELSASWVGLESKSSMFDLGASSTLSRRYDMLFSMNIAVSAGLFRNRDIVMSVDVNVEIMSTAKWRLVRETFAYLK